MQPGYLIDGYNLLHAMGVLPARLEPGELHRARGRLIGILSKTMGEASVRVTVVFDASRPPPGAGREQEIKGISIRFAPRGQEADDVIESLLHDEPHPRHLTLVSNDHRLQTAARRRRAAIMSCEEFLDLLMEHRPKNDRSTSEPEKHIGSSADETNYWLNVFGDLDKELGQLDFDFE
jgi:predicted RNA-binding protein with PIN domain